MTNDKELRDSLYDLRKYLKTDGNYPFVIGAVGPVIEAIDEFTPGTVALLRDVAEDRSPMVAASLRAVAAHIEKLLPSAEQMTVGN